MKKILIVLILLTLFVYIPPSEAYSSLYTACKLSNTRFQVTVLNTNPYTAHLGYKSSWNNELIDLGVFFPYEAKTFVVETEGGILYHYEELADVWRDLHTMIQLNKFTTPECNEIPGVPEETTPPPQQNKEEEQPPGPDMVDLTGAILLTFVQDTYLYYAPNLQAVAEAMMQERQTLYVFTQQNGFYKVLLSGGFYWVPVNTME